MHAILFNSYCTSMGPVRHDPPVSLRSWILILGLLGLPSQWWKAARKSSLSAFSPILYATASANESSLSLPLASSSFSKLKSEFASSGTAWVFATGVSSFSVLVHHMDVAEDSDSKASKSTRASPFVIFSTRCVGKVLAHNLSQVTEEKG